MMGDKVMEGNKGSFHLQVRKVYPEMIISVVVVVVVVVVVERSVVEIDPSSFVYCLSRMEIQTCMQSSMILFLLL